MPTMQHYTLTLDEITVDTARSIGEGNVSKGVRKALAMVAYMEQHSPVQLSLLRVLTQDEKP